MNHTPAPWHQERTKWRDETDLKIVGGSINCDVVALINEKGLISKAEQEANANLIAAAPELLEAARFILDASKTEPGMQIYRAHMQKLEAAISKAEGRSVINDER